MNYIRHLSGFFDRVVLDDRLNPTHISMYMSLFQIWNLNRFNNPISISRSEMMKVSKIHAKATYHKVIKDLHEFGFIKYRPSYNPFKGSEIDLIEWDEEQVQYAGNRYSTSGAKSRQAMNSYFTKTKTSNEPINEPYINNTNTTNNKHTYEQSHNNTDSNTGQVSARKKTRVTNKMDEENTTSPGAEPANNGQLKITSSAIPTSLSQVRLFFEKEKSTKLEAEKFFNYFQSNGWRVGGRSPMKDWQAAARNWMLNAQKFEPIRKTSVLHATVNKNYEEPL
jgi:hypothetical protein